MFKKLASKKAEGVVTGMLWLAVAVIATGGIAYTMWGSGGIGGAATTSKATFGTAISTAKTNALSIAP